MVDEGDDGKSGKKRKQKKDKKKKSKKTKKSKSLHKDPESDVQSEAGTDVNPLTNPNPVETSSPSSWGDVFAVAASVKPLPLGDDFMPDTNDDDDDAKAPFGSGNIGMVSQIAQQYLKQSLTAASEFEKVANDSGVDRKGDEDTHVLKEEGNVEGISDSSAKKKKKKKKRKKDKTKPDTATSLDSKQRSSQELPSPCDNHFPFPTDPDDHCESPSTAYEDILPILRTLETMKNGTSKVSIYDPYYCDGAVLSHLTKLGFNDVYNKKEDCYKTWCQSDTTQPYPTFDVLVTNPPYSGDHVPKLMQHVMADLPTRGNHAWCLLMPTYVHKKDYYQDLVKKGLCQPFYLVPKKRYVYKPPKDFRMKKESDVHKKSSPFVSMWYIWGGSKEKNAKLMDAYRRHGGVKNCELARSKSALRDLRRKKR